MTYAYSPCRYFPTCKRRQCRYLRIWTNI